jgi:hypothetical protein
MTGETLRQRVPMGRVKAHSMTMNGTEARKFDGAAGRPSLVDPFGRDISYLRVSVTDRCDFRCVYCMSENMAFLPKADVLTLESSTGCAPPSSRAASASFASPAASRWSGAAS